MILSKPDREEHIIDIIKKPSHDMYLHMESRTKRAQTELIPK